MGERSLLDGGDLLRAAALEDLNVGLREIADQRPVAIAHDRSHLVWLLALSRHRPIMAIVARTVGLYASGARASDRKA